MRGLAYYYFTSAAAYALCGMGLGIYMAATHDHLLSTVHAHLNLLGWVSLALFGLYFHAVPVAAASRLAKLHAVLATLGLWTLVPGIALVYLVQFEELAIAGSVVTIVSMALFVAIVARNHAAGNAA